MSEASAAAAHSPARSPDPGEAGDTAASSFCFFSVGAILALLTLIGAQVS